MYICVKLEDEYFIPLDILDIKKDKYLISNYGTIKNLNDVIMKPFISNTGYLRVGLATDKGKRKNYSIHRLVALMFVPNPNDDSIVNHLNGIKTENYYLNLEWTTQSSNNIHALNTGLCDNKGENSHLSKYSDELIHQMCSIMENERDPYEICVKLKLIKRGTQRSNKEYQKYRSYIKFLRSKTFRKDISKGYNI